MNKELEDRVVSEIEKLYGLIGFDANLVRYTLRYMESHKLTRRAEQPPVEISAIDKKRLEDIRERDIQRRIAESNGIIGGMRETFNVAFLLDYIDKLEGRSEEN